jgi:hypothetical protein
MRGEENLQARENGVVIERSIAV